MIIEVKVPSPGESITEVQLASWLVADGDSVERDAEIAEVDSDKATLTINASESGVIKLMVSEGDTIAVGTIIASIDTESAAAVTTGSAAVTTASATGEAANKSSDISEDLPQTKKEPSRENPITPLARKVMEERNLTDEQVRSLSSGKRIGKADVESISSSITNKVTADQQKTVSEKSKDIDKGSEVKEVKEEKKIEGGSRNTERKKLSMLRQKLSDRLVSVKNETAMLTTFNEVNMSAIMALKKKYNEKFKEKYGISIGFMSLFTKAVTIALKQFPQVNAIIDGDEMIYHDFVDVAIAVSSPKGLVVPVVRNTESLSIAEIELKIKELAEKARNNKISLEEMTGGTFTISNGGVFGSLLSTPILNPPQSAILGMHNIVERPIAQNGQVVIAPMMYLALSYDHRVIDGRESVSFLVKVKELLEQPEIMFYEGKDPVKGLLGL